MDTFEGNTSLPEPLTGSGTGSGKRSSKTNLNLTYKTKKCRHLKDKYIYLYQCLAKSWAVVVYEDDDDTIIEARYFTDWALALREYNKIKDEIDNMKDMEEKK